MSRCGWCKKSDLELVADGSLEEHTMPDTRKRCKRQDNPSLILVKHKKDMLEGAPPGQTVLSQSTDAFDAMWRQEISHRTANTKAERKTYKSVVRANQKVKDNNRGSAS